MALWKKWLLIGGACFLATLIFGKPKTVREFEAANPWIIEQRCEKIKTMDDWNKESFVWRLTNKECKPD